MSHLGDLLQLVSVRRRALTIEHMFFFFFFLENFKANSFKMRLNNYH